MRFTRNATDKPPEYLVPDVGLRSLDIDVSDCGCECATLMENLYDAGMEYQCRHAFRIRNHNPLSGKERRYGHNWPTPLKCVRGAVKLYW